MNIRREKYINEIADHLAWLKSRISLSSELRLTDLALFSEDLMCGLLNLLYGWELVNFNHLQSGYPGIDLGDEKNRVAVQVTSASKREKIEETISKFLKFRYAEKYDRLIILVLGDRKKFQKEVDTGGVFTFSIKDDVIDIGRILRDIRNCDDETLKNIYDYIEYQFIERNKKEQSFSSVEYVTDPPTNQCRFYRGRNTDENDILSWLNSGKNSYIIQGTGGIGKTELAKAIWEKVRKDGAKYGVSHLAWVPYQNSELKLSICRSFLKVKSIKNTDVAWADITEFFIKTQQGLLMFIDNIEKTEAQDPILRSLNQYPFRTIITTRQKLGIKAEETELKVLSDDECKSLFYEFYTLEKDDEKLSQILEKAGCLTVAIELLAKTAMVQEMSLRELNEALTDLEFDISEEAIVGEHDLLTKEDKIAEQLKKLFSISACNDQQIRLLVNISMFPAKEFSFEDAKRWFGEKRRTPLNELVDRGWLRSQKNSQGKLLYWMHPVLAGSIRLQTEPILYQSCRQLIYNFTEMLSQEERENPFERFSVISFAGTLETYQRKYFCDLDDLEFLKAMGDVYVEMAEYGRAIEVYQDACCIARDRIRDEEKETELNRLLGSAYKQCGNFEEAMVYYKKVMDGIENGSVHGADNVICAYRDMGHMYKSMGDYVQALSFYNTAEKRYFEEKEKDSDLSPKYLAVTYYGKGNLYRCAENYKLSKSFYEKAKDIYEDIVSDTNFEWMLIHDNIGVCYLEQGDCRKARAFHEEALKLQKHAYKETNQPFMGLTYMYRGDVYKKTGEYGLAYDDYKKAAEIIQNSVGDNHPYMIRVKNHTAKCLMEIGQYQEAEALEMEALPFECTQLGKLHPDTAELYNNLTELYCAAGDLEKAEFYHQKVKKYTDTVLSSHPETLKVWMREARYYLNNGDNEMAKEKLETLIREASEITKEAPIVEEAKKMLEEIIPQNPPPTQFTKPPISDIV